MEQPDDLISTSASETPAESPGSPAAAFEEATPALKRLGPMQFAGGTFPLMGFFASAYDHISAQAAAMLKDSGYDKGPST